MAIERRIGFHIKSMDELKRICGFKDVNLIELKPDKMRRHGDELYSFDGKDFKINKPFAKDISDFCKDCDIQIQIHVPFEKKVNPRVEEGLCYGKKEHHGKLLDRFKMIADLYNEFDIGTVVVMHPPQLITKEDYVCSYHEGIEYGREFLYTLDVERKKNNWEFKVGLENMVPPKERSITLGYTPKQLKALLGNTETIGLTVDSGHRLLAKDMSVAKMFSIAPVVSLHFHTNPGVFHQKGYEDDAHQFAEPHNLDKFTSYIRSIRRNQIPVTCEIDNLESISSERIGSYVRELRFMLE